MFRRIILTALLGIGLTAGLTLTAGAASAHEPVRHVYRGHDVVVVDHGRRHVDPWRRRIHTEHIVRHVGRHRHAIVIHPRR
jgi:hypothetical protein